MTELREIEHNLAHTILRMEDHQVMTLLRGQLPDQKLSRVVQTLNASLLDGTPKEQETARDALGRLGFI